MNITFVGDIMLGGVLSSDITKYKYTFLSPEIEANLKGDLACGNLECVLAYKEAPPDKNKILLYAQEESVELLKQARFNIVSLANNHMMDYGVRSLQKTMSLLRANHIDYAGAGNNLKEARQPVTIQKGDTKIAFLAYAAPETWGGWNQRECLTHNNWFATDNSPGVAPFDLKLVQEDLNKARIHSDFLIVSIHWGEENTRFPHPEIISDAHKVIDLGANLVVGSHPHILQGYEEYQDGLILYSLANFIFPSYYDENDGELKSWNKINRESIIFKCEISKNKILNYKFRPIIQNKSEPVLENPSSGQSKRIIRVIESISKEYSKDNYSRNYARLRRWEKIFNYPEILGIILKKYGLVRTLKIIWSKLSRDFFG